MAAQSVIMRMVSVVKDFMTWSPLFGDYGVGSPVDPRKIRCRLVMFLPVGKIGVFVLVLQVRRAGDVVVDG